MKSWWVAKIGKAFVIIAIAILVFGFIVMELWNALIPDLFHGPSVTFGQAVALLLLSHILIRGWGRWRYSTGWRRGRWKHRFDEKLAAMSPEDREKFKEEWRRRCGWAPETPH